VDFMLGIELGHTPGGGTTRCQFNDSNPNIRVMYGSGELESLEFILHVNQFH